MTQLLYPLGKSPCYPLDKRVGGPQHWSVCSGEEKNSQPLLGLKALIIQPIAPCPTTELSWLQTYVFVHINLVILLSLSTSFTVQLTVYPFFFNCPCYLMDRKLKREHCIFLMQKQWQTNNSLQVIAPFADKFLNVQPLNQVIHNPNK
jgi:hypothetical protein